MFTETAFTAAAVELSRLNGISGDLAGDYLARIGDTPELADDWRVIVRDNEGLTSMRGLNLRDVGRH